VKLLLDTNVLVSALIWSGNPYALLKLGSAPPNQIYSSPELLGELRNTLAYPRLEAQIHKRGLNVKDLHDRIALIVHTQHSPALLAPVCRDPDDDAVLACAKAAQVNLIVSGDQDLLVLQQFEGIAIVTAAHALEMLKLNSAE
jgi:putative PIN family toxin of toxin-antitoxin system